MKAIALLLGLLALSYVGSALRSERATSGRGLASGAEYLCLGVVLGSHVLGVIPRSLLDGFQPLLVVGASWVTFAAGLGYGRAGGRPLALGPAALGALGAGVLGAAVFATVYALIPRLAPELLGARLLAAGGARASARARRAARCARWHSVTRRAARSATRSLTRLARARSCPSLAWRCCSRTRRSPSSRSWLSLPAPG